MTNISIPGGRAMMMRNSVNLRRVIFALALLLLFTVLTIAQPLYQEYAITSPAVYFFVRDSLGWNVPSEPRWKPDSTRVLWQDCTCGQFTPAQKVWILSWLDAAVWHSSKIDSVLEAGGWNFIEEGGQ